MPASIQEKVTAAAAPVKVLWVIGENSRPFVGGGGAFTNINCTGGFTVKQISGTQTGLSTAGDCERSDGYYNYAGYQLQNVNAAYNTNADLRWVSQTNVSFQASVWTGGPSNWPVNNRKNWDNAYVNDPVCWYGKTTAGACGLLLTKYHSPADVPQSNPAFGTVSVTPSEQGDSGDSGGPVYYQNTAWGIVGGGNSSYTYFTPQYRLETRLGVQVRIQ